MQIQRMLARRQRQLAAVVTTLDLCHAKTLLFQFGMMNSFTYSLDSKVTLSGKLLILNYQYDHILQ